MAQNGSKVEASMVEVAAEVVTVVAVCGRGLFCRRTKRLTVGHCVLCRTRVEPLVGNCQMDRVSHFSISNGETDGQMPPTLSQPTDSLFCETDGPADRCILLPLCIERMDTGQPLSPMQNGRTDRQPSFLCIPL